jgi:hypothetical protein
MNCSRRPQVAISPKEGIRRQVQPAVRQRPLPRKHCGSRGPEALADSLGEVRKEASELQSEDGVATFIPDLGDCCVSRSAVRLERK